MEFFAVTDTRKNFLALAISCAVSALILEGAVRVLFPRNAEVVRTEQSFADPAVGVRRKANQIAKSAGACYEVDKVTYDSKGFRSDSEGSVSSRRRVIVLGDSFMEAVQVPDVLATANLLGRLLSARVDNWSIGGANTVKQMAFLDRLTPTLSKDDLVLLFFFAGNDIADNSCELHSAHAMLHELPYLGQCARQTKSGLELYGYEGPKQLKSKVPSPSWRDRLKRFCQSCQLLYETVARYAPIRSSMDRFDQQFRYTDAVFVDPEKMTHSEMKREWSEAWEITSAVLRIIHDKITSAGAKLTVVLVPSFIEQSLTWREDFRRVYSRDPPHGMDAGYAANRLAGLLALQGIDYLDLGTEFRDFSQANKLTYPYLSYYCDGHWSPLGHLTAVRAVSAHLKGRGRCTPPQESVASAGSSDFETSLLGKLESVVTPPGLAAIRDGAIYRGEHNPEALASFVAQNKCVLN